MIYYGHLFHAPVSVCILYHHPFFAASLLISANLYVAFFRLSDVMVYFCTQTQKKSPKKLTVSKQGRDLIEMCYYRLRRGGAKPDNPLILLVVPTGVEPVF
jgi:hypothetical protein